MALLTTTRQKRDAWIEWLDRCGSGKFVNQLFFGKTIGGVPDVWAEAFVALEQALVVGGYMPRSAWSYNFRGIGGASCTCSNFGNCSLHGQGIAIDIDPRLNPFIRTTAFRWSDTAFTEEQIAFIEGIRNTKGEQLWFWGGRWNSIKDYMHFEAHVDPESTEVDWSTVPNGGYVELTRATKVDDGNPALAGNFEEMQEAGVMTTHTQPGGIAFNDELATFLLKFEDWLVAKYGLTEGPPDLSAFYTKGQSDARFVKVSENVRIIR